MRQRNDFMYRLVNVEPVLSQRRFLGQRAYSADDFAGSMAFRNHPRGRPPGFLQLLRLKPAQTGAGAIDDRAERLVDFMGDRGCHLSQSCHPRNVGQLHLRVVQRIFGPLALDELAYLAA